MAPPNQTTASQPIHCQTEAALTLCASTPVTVLTRCEKASGPKESISAAVSAQAAINPTRTGKCRRIKHPDEGKGRTGDSAEKGRLG